MEETRGKCDSIQQMMDSMPCELQVTTFRWGNFEYHQFRSKNNDELQRHLPDPSILITTIATGIAHLDFRSLLRGINMRNHLVQIWAPVRIGDKKYLTTSDQPFVIGNHLLVSGEKLDGRLCSYRKHCLDYLIPIDNDMSSSDPPGRVSRNGLPEVCFDIGYYTSIEYPLRDKALNCGIQLYSAWPLSKSSGSVVELVSLLDEYQLELCKIPKRIWALNHEKFAVGGPDPKNSDIDGMLRQIRQAHDLLLAQTWFSASQYNDEAVWRLRTPSMLDVWEEFLSPRLHDFGEASYYIKKGRGVAGKAFSSKGACFCKDVTQLSIDDYSMLPNARKAGLTSCFAISLTHRDQWRDSIFIVEFFLRRIETEHGDQRTSIKNLVATMKKHLKDYRVASGQELGENLFVEVIKTSPTDKLDSFEIGAGVDNTPVLSGETQVALDHEIVANLFPGATNLNQHGGEVVDIVDARTEADQQDINSEILKNERKKRIHRDYGITRAELLQHSREKQEHAAGHFGVSRSTFKRICREHQIFRWPPRGEKRHDGPSNGAQGLVPSGNEIMKDCFAEQLPRPVQPVEQGLNSNPDSTRNAMAVKNDSNIVVKVTYGDRMIKFYLSVSSRKMALEKEITKRLPLSSGSFDIKYSDEDGDWISMTCDEDLDMCINTMGSLGKSTIKMLVNQSQDI